METQTQNNLEMDTAKGPMRLVNNMPQLQPMMSQFFQLLSSFSIQMTPLNNADGNASIKFLDPSGHEIVMKISNSKPEEYKQLQLPAPQEPEPIITLNKQVIIKVYFRKKWKVRKEPPTDVTYIFSLVQPDYELADKLED
jgi:hypothetical protein